MNSLTHATLYVTDLTAMAEFYMGVFGLNKLNFSSEQAEAMAISEVLLGSEGPRGSTLILRQYKEAGTAPLGEVMLGFSSDEINDVIDRAQAHGAEVIQALKHFSIEGETNYRGQLVIIADPEGHRCEISHIVPA